MGSEQVPVPHVLGLPFFDAYRIASRLGLEVVGQFPDGVEVDSDSAGIVVEQEPAPPNEITVGHRLRLRVGRGGEAGDREPRVPMPLEHSGHELEDSDIGGTDGDRDPELVPEPA